jgi:hypothetical protein
LVESKKNLTPIAVPKQAGDLILPEKMSEAILGERKSKLPIDIWHAEASVNRTQSRRFAPPDDA